VSTEITRSRFSTSAAVSAKSSMPEARSIKGTRKPDIVRTEAKLEIIERYTGNRGKRAIVIHQRGASALVRAQRIPPSKADAEPAITRELRAPGFSQIWRCPEVWNWPGQISEINSKHTPETEQRNRSVCGDRLSGFNVDHAVHAEAMPQQAEERLATSENDCGANISVSP
jgi:hypothetical protein